MARRKKKEELTLEEKLEQALVPVEEQPYEVPENWCWCKLSSICEYIKAGGDKPKKFSEEKTDVYNVPVIANGITNEGIIGYTDIAKESMNTITISGRGTIGHSVIREYEYVPIVRLIVIKPNWCILPKYLKYVFDYFIEEGIGSSIPQLTVPMLKNKAIPLPPLQEQQRIVKQIESLFSKLDEAKEKVQEVKESYLARRATIFSLAFTGKLTSEWRIQNNIGNNWTEKTFSEVAEIKSNLVKPSEYQTFPHIAPDNIEKRTGVLLHYNTIAEDKVTSGKHRFYPGQILYSKIRPYLSKVVMVDFNGLCSADMYPIEAKEDTKYLWYYMLCDDFLKQASSAGSRSVLPKINQKELSKLRVNIPDIDEQKEVVKILDKILPYEQKVEEHMEIVLEQINMMKKSILAKAFRGELGTNNPDEESAIELLKAILVEA